MKDVSVLILTHDRPDFLRSALRSVLQQTAKERISAVVVSDNGSERRAAEVCKEFPELPIKYVQAPLDTDFCAHAHWALSRVSSPLLALLHDDDWWHPGHLSVCLEQLDARPSVGYVAAATLWLENEISCSPPFYFNFEILNCLKGGDGIRPVSLSWKDILMATWVYTPYHLSSVVGRTEVLLGALDVWKTSNFLVDRLYFAALAARVRCDVVYLPYVSVMVRMHEEQVTRDWEGGAQREGAQYTVQQIRELAAGADVSLNHAWRSVAENLPVRVAAMAGSLAAECLPQSDLAEMCLPSMDLGSPWLPRAASTMSLLCRDLRRKVGGLRENIDSLHSSLAHLVGATASRIVEIVRTFKPFVARADVDSLLTHLKSASRALQNGKNHKAAEEFLRTSVLGLGIVAKVRGKFVGKALIRHSTLEALSKQVSIQQSLMGNVAFEESERKLPFDTAYYQAAVGLSFASRSEAEQHYNDGGWRSGVTPHPLFVPGYFLKNRPIHASSGDSPWKQYQRALRDGLAVPIHPSFSGEWSRSYLWDTPKQADIGTVKPLSRTPKDHESAREFARITPRICTGIILYRNTVEEVRKLLMTVGKALSRAKQRGMEGFSVALTDNSQTWGAEAIAELSRECGIQGCVFPTSSNIGFGAGHNHLMRHAFGELNATHYLCLNPDGYLHPEALGELGLAIRNEELPALVEALQFPSEHPKDYDSKTFETGWCSGASTVIPRFLFELTGGYDESFFMYCEDVDLSWRVWQLGFPCRVVPTALFYHHVESREPNVNARRLMLESGRMLGAKWGNERFKLECERKLIDEAHYKHVAYLPAVPPFAPHEPHAWVDFQHHFTFATPRW